MHVTIFGFFELKIGVLKKYHPLKGKEIHLPMSYSVD